MSMEFSSEESAFGTELSPWQRFGSFQIGSSLPLGKTSGQYSFDRPFHCHRSKFAPKRAAVSAKSPPAGAEPTAAPVPEAFAEPPSPIASRSAAGYIMRSLRDSARDASESSATSTEMLCLMGFQLHFFTSATSAMGT